jgi:tetratricopeptide (TPR) repeat protein
MALTQPKPDVERLFAEADALERAGRLLDAVVALRRVLALAPGHADALTRLGLIAVRTNNPRDAVLHFEAALKSRPDAAEAHNNLAMLHLHLGRPDKALPHALFSYERNRRSLETLKILFKCAFQLGRPDEARGYLEEALALKPGDPALTLDLAQTWDMSGEPGKAAALYRKLIKAGHNSVFAYDGLARAQTYAAEPPEYAEMTALLASGRLAERHRPWLHGALGKIDDDLGRYDRAFAHFSALRSARRAGDYVDHFAAYVAQAKQICTRDFFAERAGFASASARPVFIFGMPRSGTTLVDQILSSHPDVHSANELTFFHVEIDGAFPKERGGAAFARGVRDWPAEAAKAMAGDYLDLLAAHSPAAKRVTDKMPHNFERLWLPALLFPNASFIHCRRNPIATCVSCYTQPLSRMHAYTDDLAALGRYYRLYVELMAHWREVLPVRMLELDYEGLVREPEAQSRRLVDHLGLEWNDACLRFHEVKRSVTTPSRRQVEEPIHDRAIEAWRRYEPHLGALIGALGDSDGRGSGHSEM